MLDKPKEVEHFHMVLGEVSNIYLIYLALGKATKANNVYLVLDKPKEVEHFQMVQGKASNIYLLLGVVNLIVLGLGEALHFYLLLGETIDAGHHIYPVTSMRCQAWLAIFTKCWEGWSYLPNVRWDQ